MKKRYIIYNSGTEEFFTGWELNIPKFSKNQSEAKIFENMGTGGPQQRKLQIYFSQNKIEGKISLRISSATADN